MSALLRVKDLKKENILKGIMFEMTAGEMVAVVGPSGSGKSTLLYNVSGMDKADGGEVWLGDTEITSLNEDEKASLRLNRMGFVFQQMNMLSNLNIIDNITFPAVHADKKHRKDYYDRAKKLMEDFHISHIADRRIKDVSGGELQRACICRSMIMEPEIIFADEPTGALNQSAVTDVMEVFLSINRSGASILMVTHDSRIASMCERIIYILDGQIKGEMKLGKFIHDEERDRELKTLRWLESMGW